MFDKLTLGGLFVTITQNNLAMNELHELPNPWESFQYGRPEAFRYYFHLHNYRIYCYLLQISKDSGQAEELTRHAFIALFRGKELIRDEEHLLRRLYQISRVANSLRLQSKWSSVELEEEMANSAEDDANIMDDRDVARNETLIALQGIMQKLPPAKREVAELYFFQGLSVRAIARLLRIDEQSVREYISQSLKRLGDELSGKDSDRNDFSVVRA